MLHCTVSALPCRHIKESSANALAQPYDLATLQEVLGALPSWLAGIGGATEDLAWLNKLLAQVGTDTAVVTGLAQCRLTLFSTLLAVLLTPPPCLHHPSHARLRARYGRRIMQVLLLFLDACSPPCRAQPSA
jgi:hypothetical protein